MFLSLFTKIIFGLFKRIFTLFTLAQFDLFGFFSWIFKLEKIQRNQFTCWVWPRNYFATKDDISPKTTLTSIALNLACFFFCFCFCFLLQICVKAVKAAFILYLKTEMCKQIPQCLSHWSACCEINAQVARLRHVRTVCYRKTSPVSTQNRGQITNNFWRLLDKKYFAIIWE